MKIRLCVIAVLILTTFSGKSKTIITAGRIGTKESSAIETEKNKVTPKYTAFAIGTKMPIRNTVKDFLSATPILNVLDFGVVNDSATDNTAALNALFANIVTKNAWIHFPGGKGYIISDSIKIMYPCKITGNAGLSPYVGTTGTNPIGTYQGGSSLIIQTNGSKSGFIIEQDGTYVDGLTVVNKGSPTAGAGIKVVNGNSLRIYNTFIGNFFTNLSILTGVDMVISNNQFSNPRKYNMYVDCLIPDEGCSTINGNMFNNSICDSVVQLYMAIAAGIRIVNNEFHIGTGQAGPHYSKGSIWLNLRGSTSEPIISNNGIEAYNEFGIRISAVDTTVTFGRMNISDNHLEAFVAWGVRDIEIISPKFENFHNVTVSGNGIVSNGVWKACYYKNIYGLTVGGNNIYYGSYAEVADSIVDCADVRYIIKGTTIVDSLKILAEPTASSISAPVFLTRNITTKKLEKLTPTFNTSYLPKWNGTNLISSQIFDNGFGVGVNQPSPAARVHIASGDGSVAFAVSGNSKGLRVYPISDGILMQGVDNTLFGSYQPLTIGGSKLTLQSGGANDMVTLTDYLSVGIGTNSPDPSSKLDVKGNLRADKYFVSALNSPPNCPSDLGKTGEIRITAEYIYVCIETNTWVRTALTSW
jgi:hypothetical protein